MSHTKIPWRVSKRDGVANIRSTDKDGHGIIAKVYVRKTKTNSVEEYQANADFIVKAVNLHEELVAALKGWAGAAKLKMIVPIGAIDIETPLKLTEAVLVKAEGKS